MQCLRAVQGRTSSFLVALDSRFCNPKMKCKMESGFPAVPLHTHTHTHTLSRGHESDRNSKVQARTPSIASKHGARGWHDVLEQ